MRDYRLYFEDLLESLSKIEAYTAGFTFKKFAKDQKTIDAVVRNFSIVGEATRQLPDVIKAKYPDIEWKAMIDFRNVIIHEYFGVDHEILWDIIQTKLPPLKKKLKSAVKAFPQQK